MVEWCGGKELLTLWQPGSREGDKKGLLKAVPSDLFLQ
jgi:hypothetical protein